MRKRNNTKNWASEHDKLLKYLERKMERDQREYEKLTPRQRYELRKQEQKRWES